MTQSKFFQFPIGCLHTGTRADLIEDDAKPWLFRRMIFHACDYAGQIMVKRKMEEWAQERAQEEAEKREYQWALDYIEEYGEIPETLVQQIIGAMITGVTLGGEPGKIARGQKDYTILPEFGRRYVRVKAEFVWDIRDNPSWKWREFAVLCAIYAGIGTKPFTILSYDQIAAMAQGYNGIREFADQKKEPERMTNRQVQWTVKKLLSKGFFTMVCPDRRKNYYSNRLSQKELVTAVARSIAKRKARKAIVAVQNEACREEIDRLLDFQDLPENRPFAFEWLDELTAKPKRNPR